MTSVVSAECCRDAHGSASSGWRVQCSAGRFNPSYGRLSFVVVVVVVVEAVAVVVVVVAVVVVVLGVVVVLVVVVVVVVVVVEGFQSCSCFPNVRFWFRF